VPAVSDFALLPLAHLRFNWCTVSCYPRIGFEKPQIKGAVPLISRKESFVFSSLTFKTPTKNYLSFSV
jgi:hypothetical protein